MIGGAGWSGGGRGLGTEKYGNGVLVFNLTFYPYIRDRPLIARVIVIVLFQALLMTYLVMPRVREF